MNKLGLRKQNLFLLKHFLRALRFIGLTLVVFVTLTTAFVYFYSDQIKNILLSELDKNVKEEVSVKIEDVSLTWWTHFPNISLELENVNVTQQIRNKSDTLVQLEHIGLGLDVSELMANDFTIEKIFLKEGQINLRIFDGKFNNYSIFKKNTKDSTSIALDLEKITVKKVYFSYENFKDQHLYSIYFNNNKLKFKYRDTETTSQLKGDLHINKIIIKGKEYIGDRAVKTNIKLAYTGDDKKFQLKKSTLEINGGKFDLNGFFINNDQQLLDFSFKAHEGKLSVISSLLPSSIASEINKYKTKGKVYFDGKVKGKLAKGNNPAIDVNFGFKDASFTDPKTKQAITHANLNGSFTNGRLRNAFSTKLLIDDFSIKLQGGTAKGSFLYSNFADPQIDVQLDAKLPFNSLINLIGNEHFHSPKGFLSAKINIKSPLYLLVNNPKSTKITSKGELKLDNISFGIKNSDINCKAINGHFLINKTDLGIVNFEGKAGNSDFKLDGIISQFIPFVFGYGDKLLLQGGFKSKFIDLDQLLSQNIDTKQKKNEPKQHYNFKISPWLSFDLDCSFNKVKFRKLQGKDEMRNLSGALHLKNQLFTYDHIRFTVASGKFENKGFINAKDENNIQFFNKCNLSQLDVQEFFYVFENFNQDFITDKNIKGKLHGSYDVTLLFDKALRVNLKKIKLNTDLKITYGELINFAPLQEMGKYLSKKKYKRFVRDSDLKRVKFAELKSNIRIINGMILIPKITIKNSLNTINISGTHSMDNNINYKIDFPLVNYNKVEAGTKIDESKYLNIFMEIAGTTKKYEVNVKQTEILRDLKQVIQETVKDEPKPDQTIELDLDEDAIILDIE